MSVSPTRMNLLVQKKRLRLADRGQELLQEKLDALLMNFFQYTKEYRDHRQKTLLALSEAYQAFRKAVVASGERRIRLLVALSSPVLSVKLEERNVMGVRLPSFHIEESLRGSSYPLSESTSYIDDAVMLLAEVSEKLIRLAELTGEIVRLYSAILSTRRKVNTLKHVVLPRIEGSVSTIEQVLAEREREDFFRLKRIKSKLAEKKEAG
ncbi:MAG: V-type ATP synthase subunit D [Candidatus Geothermarchaeales archaeon]